MLRNKRTRNILLAAVCVLVAVTIFSAVCAIVGAIRASKPHVNCNLNGTFTRELHQDGSTTWSPYEPVSATIHASTTAEGLGKVSIKLVSGKAGLVNGTGGTSVPSASKERNVGRWGNIISFPLLPEWYTGRKIVNISNSALVPTADNTYTWTATVELCISTVRFASATWSDEAKTCKEHNYQGSWTVKTEKVCPECDKYVDSFTEHQITCPGCGSTYWSCSPTNELAQNQFRHQRIVCSGSETVFGNLPDGRSFGQLLRACGATFYRCQISNHRKNQCSACGYYYKRCQGHTCSAGNSQSPRGNSGTVSNGGNTGGTTGGTSSDRVRCGHGRNGNACRYGGWASSREAHKTTCPAGHRYYACSAGGASKHANCRARRSGEVRCAQGSYCRSGGWASSRNAHQTTCSAGHTYWSCWPSSVSRHRRH